METEKPMKTQSETIIDKLLSHIVSECSVADTDKMYDDMLDECSSCCDMCKQYGAARILKEFDPIAYRCGKNDYIDGCEITEVNGNEYHDDEIEKAKEEFIDELRDELADLEREQDGNDPDDLEELRNLASKIAEKESEIAECERCEF